MHYFALFGPIYFHRKFKFLSRPSMKLGLWLYFDWNYVSNFEICWLFQMNLVGEFSLICHLEILRQTFRLILLLALQMMAAWAKETARLIFTEESLIYKKKQNWLPERQKIKFDFAWLQHPVGINTIMCVAFSSQKKNKSLQSLPQTTWIKVKSWWQILPQHQSTYLRGPESLSIEMPAFRPKFTYVVKVPINVSVVE